MSNSSFIKKAGKDGIRVDGRDARDSRKIKIQILAQPGSCLVSLGNTKVLANVSAEITNPTASASQDGSITINTQLSQISNIESPEMELNLSRMLERMLKESRAIDTEGLCIIAGEKVWNIRVDIRVLNHDGNIIDCASVAAMTALMHFKRPDVTVEGRDHSFDEKIPVPLSIHHIPISITFAFFDNGAKQFVDPCREEELAQDGKITIVLNVHGEICAMLLAGGIPLSPDKVILCTRLAEIKVAEITKIIKDALSLTL